MQRRAAAIYAVFFVVVAVGAYAMIGVAQEPAISIQNPDYTLRTGDAVTVDGRQYDVSVGLDGGAPSADLTWTNESAVFAETLENDTTVPATEVQWQGQTARHSVRLENGSTVPYNGSQYELIVEGDGITLRRGDDTHDFGVGDTVGFRGNRTTVVAIADDAVTLAWGDPYRVLVAATADPDAMTFRQEFNVTAFLVADPAVEDETVTRADGRRYVVYAANGTTRPLDAYLPDPERKTFSEGETFRYRGNEVTVGNITPTGIPLTWQGPRQNTVSAAEGDNVTLNDQRFTAHFPDNNTLVLTSDLAGYQNQVAVRETYHERINGLWGVTILSGLAAITLLGMAYLPSRY